MTPTTSTAGVTELERRRDRAAAALEAAAARAALGDDVASVDVERHAEAVAAYERALGATRAAADRSYAQRTGRSFFADVIASAKHSDDAARRRLDEATVDYRSTTGNYGGLVVPRRLSDQVADSGQPRRPLADVLTRPLPPTGSPVLVSRVSTGASASVQSTEASSIGTQTNMAITETSLPIVTVVDLVDVSDQVVNRSDPADLDALIAREVVGAVDAKVETQIIAGDGTGGQAHGLLHTTSSGSVTLSTTSGVDLLDAIAEAAADSTTAAGAPADLVVMHPRRWQYLLAAVGDRSAAVAQAAAPGPVAGRVLGMDVVASLGVPTTLGTSTNEDRIVVVRRADLYYAETPPQVRIVRDVNAGATSLKSRIEVWRYASFGSFQPTGVRIVSGSGLVDPF